MIYTSYRGIDITLIIHANENDYNLLISSVSETKQCPPFPLKAWTNSNRANEQTSKTPWSTSNS